MKWVLQDEDGDYVAFVDEKDPDDIIPYGWSRFVENAHRFVAKQEAENWRDRTVMRVLLNGGESKFLPTCKAVRVRK